MKFPKALAILTAAVVSLGSTAQASESDYPRKPINVVVPYGPGGAADMMMRIFGEHMSQTLGQQIVVMNRPGANANIAPSVVAKAAPDGYTLLASSAALIVNPLLDDKLDWKESDFVPVANYVKAPSVFVVPNTIGVSTLAEFVKYAKANPGQATNRSSSGNTQAVSREFFLRSADIELLHVGYKGGTTWMTDLIAGRLALTVAPVNVVAGPVKDGQIKAIAITSPERSQHMPDVPTLAESGFPEATAVSWYGMHAPAGTPDAVIRRLSDAIRAASADPTVRARVKAAGSEVSYIDTVPFAQYLAAEKENAARYVRLIKSD